MIAEYENPEREEEVGTPRQYALSQTHKHLPEMKAVTGISDYPVFSPIVSDYFCGMAVTVPLFTKAFKKEMTLESLYDFYYDFYRDSTFITVHKAESTMISPIGLEGTNQMKIRLCGNDDRITVTSVFDNLGKGASSAAIENMNIALGFPIDTALI